MGFMGILAALAILVMPDAHLQQVYAESTQTAASSGQCAIAVASARVREGRIPAGLRLDGQGEIRGIPREIGRFRFTVEWTDGCRLRVGERELRVQEAPVIHARAEAHQFSAIEGAPAFAAAGIRIDVDAPGMPYRVEVLEGGWLRATPRAGRMPPGGAALIADRVDLRVDPRGLAPGTHRARVRISAWQSVNAPELEFALEIEPVASLVAERPSVVIPPRATELPRVRVQPPPVVAPPLPVLRRATKAGPRRTTRPSGVTRSRVLPIPVAPRKPSALAPAAKSPVRAASPH